MIVDPATTALMVRILLLLPLEHCRLIDFMAVIYQAKDDNTVYDEHGEPMQAPPSYDTAVGGTTRTFSLLFYRNTFSNNPTVQFLANMSQRPLPKLRTSKSLLLQTHTRRGSPSLHRQPRCPRRSSTTT